MGRRPPRQQEVLGLVGPASVDVAGWESKFNVHFLSQHVRLTKQMSP